MPDNKKTKKKTGLHNGRELPLAEPVYHANHEQGSGGAAIVANPSIENWYLNHALNLKCSQRFLTNLCPIHLTVENSSWRDVPHFETVSMDLRFTQEQTNSIIEKLLYEGYYVYFSRVDNYYICGKKDYLKKHRYDDGMIFGHDQEHKTFLLYAYDENDVYRTFTTPKKAFQKAVMMAAEKGIYGTVVGIKPTKEEIAFDSETVLSQINRYLQSSMLKYPQYGSADVYGIVVQKYVAMYLEKLMEGFIPFQYVEREIFELLFEHKSVMLKCIRKLEEQHGLSDDVSGRYALLVDQMNILNILFQSCHSKDDMTILMEIRDKLLAIYRMEIEILTGFASRFRRGVYIEGVSGKGASSR